MPVFMVLIFLPAIAAVDTTFPFRIAFAAVKAMFFLVTILKRPTNDMKQNKCNKTTEISRWGALQKLGFFAPETNYRAHHP